MQCRSRLTRTFIWGSLLVILALLLGGNAILAGVRTATFTEAPRSPSFAMTTSITFARLTLEPKRTLGVGPDVVADVRLKIRMRLRATLAAIQADARPGGVLLQIFEVAKTNHVAADAIQAHYRTWVAREFPGCLIEYGRKYIYIYLPDTFGAGRAPVMEQLPIALVPVFHPIREVAP